MDPDCVALTAPGSNLTSISGRSGPGSGRSSMGSVPTTVTTGSEADTSISSIVCREMIVKGSSSARSKRDTSIIPSVTEMASMTTRSPTHTGWRATALPSSLITGTTK